MIYRLFRIYISVVFSFFITGALYAQQSCGGGCQCGAEDITPAGLSISHVHEKGSWMLSYSYMHMDMNGNIYGDRGISNASIYQQYIMAPDHMTMDMHMLMAMYGVTDRLTLMGMASYQATAMNMNMIESGMHMNMPGMASNGITMPDNQSINGLGDSRLFALYRIKDDETINVNGALGINIPTGSVTQLAYPGQYSNVLADYNMQNGTGSWDFIPGLSVIMHNGHMDYGAEALGTIRPFNNNRAYHFGNEARLELWAARKWTDWVSTSVRAEAVAKGSISGSDTAIYAVMEPSANPVNYGGFQSWLAPGVNFYSAGLLPQIIRLRFEYGIPLYQYAQGIQMANRSLFTANLDILF